MSFYHLTSSTITLPLNSFLFQRTHFEEKVNLTKYEFLFKKEH
ncbi:hypothetical protein D068_cds20580 [Bacillus atrophaeus UCMB-5137]|nr:hypothetical protein D068_cds20580 [Bacillus atrophaeus UCMB-5137]